jgi:general secretion pathway protein L
MAILVVILPERADAPALWGVFEKNSGRILRSGKQPADQAFTLTEEEAPDQTWVVVPGTQVLARTITVPPQADTHLRKAVSYMLEDDLAVDSAEMHFALGSESTDEHRLVAAVSHAMMKTWIARLSALELKANILVPDFLAVPVVRGEAVIIDRGDVVTVRVGEIGYTIEPSAFEWLLDTFKNVRAIRLLTNTSDLLSGPLQVFRDLVTSEALSDDKLLAESYLALSGGGQINLLQGSYAPRRNWGAIGREWRRAAVLVGAVLLLGLGLLIVDSVRLSRHADMATARAEAVFRQALPDIKQVVNPRVQMRTRLSDIKTRVSTGFLRSSDIIFRVVSGVDGAEIQTLRFDAKRGEAAVTLSMPSYDAIERVKAGVKLSGGTVNEGGARQDGDRIIADITVRVP